LVVKRRTSVLIFLLVSAAGLAMSASGASSPLDPSFGHGGKVKTAFGSDDWATAVALGRKGKIVVTGASLRKARGPTRIALARYLRNGRRDPSFGKHGKLLSRIGSSPYAADVSVLPSGKTLVGGSTFLKGNKVVFLLARYRPNGALDRTFGQNGAATVAFRRSDAEASALALQPNGKILLAGWESTGKKSKSRYGFALARFRRNGILDRSFGQAGRVKISFGKQRALGTSLAVASNGAIVLAGYTAKLLQVGPGLFEPIPQQWALARVNASGQLDPSFGAGGKVMTQLGTPDPYFGDAAYAVRVLPNRKIVAVGAAFDGYSEFAVARYMPDGTLDQSFGSAGKTIAGFGPDYSNTAFAMALTSDGKILTAGYSNDRFALARYLPDGGLDPSFGSGGTIATKVGRDSHGNDLALQPDGKAVVVGSSDWRSRREHFMVLRYLARP
jgi:uncharacterized delta-60 repeat protein